MAKWAVLFSALLMACTQAKGEDEIGGDVSDPTGGVRNVIPGKGKYPHSE